MASEVVLLTRDGIHGTARSLVNIFLHHCNAQTLPKLYSGGRNMRSDGRMRTPPTTVGKNPGVAQV